MTILIIHLTWVYLCLSAWALLQSFSSEPSGQSSLPSHSFSGGRQMESLLAQTWWESLHSRASQFSSSELSSQSLSLSHTQALLIQRAKIYTKKQKIWPKIQNSLAKMLQFIIFNWIKKRCLYQKRKDNLILLDKNGYMQDVSSIFLICVQADYTF